MNAQIELGRARLLLDQGRDDDADAALGKASYLLGDLEEFTLLKSRLDVRRGNYDKAFQRLRKGLKPGADALDSSEGYALLAISARATGHKEELDKALKKARENGADVSALAGS
jgi:tetratricopeptide (TPR) repeat protein